MFEAVTQFTLEIRGIYFSSFLHGVNCEKCKSFQAVDTITKLKSKEGTLKRRNYYNKSEEEGWFPIFC